METIDVKATVLFLISAGKRRPHFHLSFFLFVWNPKFDFVSLLPTNSHRYNCNGNYQCINECSAPRVDRCSGCNVYGDEPILTRCEPGKWLYYVQVPRNISINDFVSNADLLNLYTNSNLDLNSSGISGRACLNDRTRLDLQRLNATITSVPNAKK